MKKISSHKVLEKELETNKKSGKIREFILATSVSNDMYFGVDGRDIGGAYRPLCSNEDFSGDLFIEWTDGLVSNVNISTAWLKEFGERLNKAYLVAYEDDASKNYLEQPKNNSFTLQKDGRLADSKSDFRNEIGKKIQKYQEWMSGLGEENRHITVGCGVSEVFISNSRGLNINETFTETSEGCSLGDYTGFGESERGVISETKIDKYKKRTAIFYKKMKTDVKLQKKNISIIFDMDTFGSLLGHFLVGNILAGNIYRKSSKYSLDDFKDNLKICSDNFGFSVNANKAMTVGAGNFSDIGWVYPDNYEFIKDGRLIAPISSYRHARLLDIEPGPPVTTLKLVNFGNLEHIRELELSISESKTAILATGLLGLHTQDSNRGDFSVVAPYSLVVDGGEVIGSTEVMLRGNFFDILKNLEVVYRDSLTELPFIQTDLVEVYPTK